MENSELKHVMIDIETLGTEPGCLITQIAAMKFDPMNIQIDHEGAFMKTISITSYDKDVIISADTIKWWVNENPELFIDSLLGEETITQTITEFVEFCFHSTHFWAKSPGFDMDILEHQLDICNFRPPWNFRSVYDVRTALEVAGVKQPEAKIPHDPLSDCEAQIRGVFEAYKRLRKNL